jgi:hypothetical protein
LKGYSRHPIPYTPHPIPRLTYNLVVTPLVVRVKIDRTSNHRSIKLAKDANCCLPIVKNIRFAIVRIAATAAEIILHLRTTSPRMGARASARESPLPPKIKSRFVIIAP